MPPLQAERAAPEGRTDIKKTAAAAHANLPDDFCNEIGTGLPMWASAEFGS